jgi:putative sterol carrier protein
MLDRCGRYRDHNDPKFVRLPYLSPEWFEALDAAVASSVFAPGVRLVVQHVVDDCAYHVSIADGRARVAAGLADEPTVTFTQDRATAAEIAQGRLSAQQAFMSGRMTVRGDLPALATAQDVLAELDRAFDSVRDQTAF